MKVLFVLTIAVWMQPAVAAEPVVWPDNTRVAISLSYDDALASQLDHAVPALQRYGFKASFYLTLANPLVRARLNDWRAVAASGHELGNHTIYHACRGSLPDRAWVSADRDLDKRSLVQARDEVIMANTILHIIDGRDERTFTPPCGDQLAGGENYVDVVEPMFVGVKTRDRGMAMSSSYLHVPTDVSGEELIRYVEDHTRDGVLLNILFHGVGGDHLSVSTEAHAGLLQFLDENSEIYWVDTYINIMSHVREQAAN